MFYVAHLSFYNFYAKLLNHFISFSFGLGVQSLKLEFDDPL